MAAVAANPVKVNVNVQGTAAQDIANAVTRQMNLGIGNGQPAAAAPAAAPVAPAPAAPDQLVQNDNTPGFWEKVLKVLSKIRTWTIETVQKAANALWKMLTDALKNTTITERVVYGVGIAVAAGVPLLPEFIASIFTASRVAWGIGTGALIATPVAWMTLRTETFEKMREVIPIITTIGAVGVDMTIGSLFGTYTTYIALICSALAFFSYCKLTAGVDAIRKDPNIQLLIKQSKDTIALVSSISSTAVNIITTGYKASKQVYSDATQVISSTTKAVSNIVGGVSEGGATLLNGAKRVGTALYTAHGVLLGTLGAEEIAAIDAEVSSKLVMGFSKLTNSYESDVSLSLLMSLITRSLRNRLSVGSVACIHSHCACLTLNFS